MEKFSFRKDPVNRYTHPEAIIEFEPTTRCNYIEILQHVRNGTCKVVCSEGSLDDGNMNGWLDKDLTWSAESDELAGGNVKFAGGLRLIYGVCGFPEGRRTMPFTTSVYQTLERRLGINPEFKKIIMGTTSRAVRFSVDEGYGDEKFRPQVCHILKFSIFRPSYYTLTLTHSPTQNLTHAILLSQTTHHQIPSLLSSLKTHQTYINHPLLTPALLAPIIVASTARRIAAIHQGMNDVEEALGQHEYENVPVRNPLEGDFLTIGRRLSWCGGILGVEKLRARSMEGTLGWILGVLGEEEAEESGGFGADETYGRSRRVVRERVLAELNAVQNLTLRAEYEEGRRGIQGGVVYQFMAQKEAITNGQVARTSAIIAQESRKDSSAMKAIAVLTMFFLPGTFLAAIFAMPVFNWQDPDFPVVKQGFTYYCAIGVPLTVFVLTIWGLAVWVPWERFLGRRGSAGMGVGMESGLEIDGGDDRVLWEGVQARGC